MEETALGQVTFREMITATIRKKDEMPGVWLERFDIYAVEAQTMTFPNTTLKAKEGDVVQIKVGACYKYEGKVESADKKIATARVQFLLSKIGMISEERLEFAKGKCLGLARGDQALWVLLEHGCVSAAKDRARVLARKHTPFPEDTEWSDHMYEVMLNEARTAMRKDRESVEVKE